MEKKSKLIILQGPPCSGKSTWAKKYIKGKEKNTIIVCRDSIRLALCGGDVTTMFQNMQPNREDLVTQVENTMIEQGLANGYDVIVDATNLNSKTIKRLSKINDKYQTTIVFEKFYIPFEEALKRDNERKENGGHSVGKSVLKRFYQTYYKEEYEKEQSKFVEHKRIEIDQTLPPAIICDIDGTIAWMQGRYPYDLTKVQEDKVDPRLKQLLYYIFESGVEVIFLSGREGTPLCKAETLKWLKDNIEGYERNKLSSYDGVKFELFMRNANDYRGDEIVKKEIYEREIKGKYDVICVFDDRNKVVDMWREEGLLCCQVAEGNF